MRLSKQARNRILKQLEEQQAYREAHHSERRRYLSSQDYSTPAITGLYTTIVALALAVYTQHSDYLVAGGGVLVAAGVFIFSIPFRDRVTRGLENLSTVAQSGEDDREITNKLLEKLFKSAEYTSFWYVVIGTLVSNFAGLVWRGFGWA